MTSEQDQGAATESPPRVPAHLHGGALASASPGLCKVEQQEEEGMECTKAQADAPLASACPPTAAAAPAPPHAFPPAAADDVPEPGAGQPEASAQPSPPAGSGGKVEPGRHLLRHALTPEVAAAATAEFGSDKSAAGHAIWELKQPELRSAFARIYRFQTRSSNNGWLRGKLLKAVGLDATWIPEQPETPQDADLPQHASQPPPNPAADAAAEVAPNAAAVEASQRRPMRQAALAHKPWQASEVEGEEEPKRRRKRAPHAQRPKRPAQEHHSPAASLSPPPAEAEDGRAGAGAASASASASTGDTDPEQAAPQAHGRKRQLPGGAAVQPGKRQASPDSAQSPAPPSAIAAAAFGMPPAAHAQQLAAAVLEAGGPWPSSGSGSTVQPLADAWPRMLAAAACGVAPLPPQLACLPPQLFALAQGGALDPAAEGELLRLLLQPHVQPGPVQLQLAHWAPWAGRGQPPPVSAALPHGHVAVLGPGGPPAPVHHTWGSHQQLPLIAVMAPGLPPQPLEQQAMQQLAVFRMQQAQAQQRMEEQQHMEAQLLAAGLLAPGQPQTLLPVRLAALPAAGPGPAVRPPTPHDSQLQQAAAMHAPHPPQAPHAAQQQPAAVQLSHLPQAPQQLGATLAWLPPGWAAAGQQPWPAFAAASGGGAPLGGCDVQRFREQQVELELRAQQYRHEQHQAAQHAQQAQRQQQAQQEQPPSPQQPGPSPFAAYAAIAPPDATWLPQQLQASGAAAAAPAGSPRAAGAAASPRALARPTFPHHTLSADLHTLFSAYADGQLSMPLPQAPS